MLWVDVAIPEDGNGKQIRNRVQEFMYGDGTNVQCEIRDYTGKDWSPRNTENRFKEKFGIFTRTTFGRFST
jgi:hypothetical protein